MEASTVTKVVTGDKDIITAISNKWEDNNSGAVMALEVLETNKAVMEIAVDPEATIPTIAKVVIGNRSLMVTNQIYLSSSFTPLYNVYYIV